MRVFSMGAASLLTALSSITLVLYIETAGLAGQAKDVVLLASAFYLMQPLLTCGASTTIFRRSKFSNLSSKYVAILSIFVMSNSAFISFFFLCIFVESESLGELFFLYTCYLVLSSFLALVNEIHRSLGKYIRLQLYSGGVQNFMVLMVLLILEPSWEEFSIKLYLSIAVSVLAVLLLTSLGDVLISYTLAAKEKCNQDSIELSLKGHCWLIYSGMTTSILAYLDVFVIDYLGTPEHVISYTIAQRLISLSLAPFVFSQNFMPYAFAFAEDAVRQAAARASGVVFFLTSLVITFSVALVMFFYFLNIASDFFALAFLALGLAGLVNVATGPSALILSLKARAQSLGVAATMSSVVFFTLLLLAFILNSVVCVVIAVSMSSIIRNVMNYFEAQRVTSGRRLWVFPSGDVFSRFLKDLELILSEKSQKY